MVQSPIAQTPEPPYYAVVFTSLRNTYNETNDETAYSDMAVRMADLAAQQPGYLGMETAREQLGITVSYWSDLESIQRWKANLDHQQAQRLGREAWYSAYCVRIAKVEREYGM